MIFRRYRRIIKELRKRNLQHYYTESDLIDDAIRLKVEIGNLKTSINKDREFYSSLIENARDEAERNREYKDKYIKLLAALEVKGVEITLKDD